MEKWSLWLGRLLISAALTAAVAWGIAFQVSDYVVKAALLGYDANVETLNQNVSRVDQIIQRLDGRQEDSQMRILQEMAGLQQSNALLERDLILRFDALLDRIDGTNSALGSLASSMSSTSQQIQQLDARQREFESLVLRTMLHTTDPASFKADWYVDWGFAASDAALLKIDSADVKKTLGQYVEGR